MPSEIEADGLSGSNEALAAYLERYEYTVVFERADGRFREELDRPTIEGTSGHRSTLLFAESRRSRGPRAHAKWVSTRREERVRSSCVAGRVQRVRESLHSRAGRRRRREVSAAPGQTPRLDSSNEEGTSLAGRSDWRRVYPPSHPDQPGSRSEATGFGSRASGGARSAVALASRFDCRGVKKAAQRLLTGSSGRTGTGHSSFIANRSGRRVSIADSRSVNLARGATPGRSGGSDVVGASLHHRRRRGTVVFAWTRGSSKPCPGRTNGLLGRRSNSFDEGVSRRKPRRVFARHVSRHPLRMGRQIQKQRPSGLAGACLHPSKPTRAARLQRREGSNGFAPRARGTAKRQLDRATSIAHRPVSSSSQPQGRPPNRKEGSRAGFAMAQRVHEAPVVC
jgi:hypothetical protein